MNQLAQEKVVAVIQARMNSTRLPGKVLLPLAGAPLLQRLIERVKPAGRVDVLAVATSDAADCDPVAALCAGLGVRCFRGSENDVLARVLAAAEALGADVVVRLTGDNPMVGADLVDFLLDAFLAEKPPPDYANTVDRTGFPVGLAAEAITIDALRRAAESDNPDDREHVTRFVRRQPGAFRCLEVRAPLPLPPIDLTIDTESDYQRVMPLFEKLYERNPQFGFRDLATLTVEGVHAAH